MLLFYLVLLLHRHSIAVHGFGIGTHGVERIDEKESWVSALIASISIVNNRVTPYQVILLSLEEDKNDEDGVQKSATGFIVQGLSSQGFTVMLARGCISSTFSNCSKGGKSISHSDFWLKHRRTSVFLLLDENSVACHCDGAANEAEKNRKRVERIEAIIDLFTHGSLTPTRIKNLLIVTCASVTHPIEFDSVERVLPLLRHASGRRYVDLSVIQIRGNDSRLFSFDFSTNSTSITQFQDLPSEIDSSTLPRRNLNLRGRALRMPFFRVPPYSTIIIERHNNSSVISYGGLAIQLVRLIAQGINATLVIDIVGNENEENYMSSAWESIKRLEQGRYDLLPILVSVTTRSPTSPTRLGLYTTRAILRDEVHALVSDSLLKKSLSDSFSKGSEHQVSIAIGELTKLLLSASIVAAFVFLSHRIRGLDAVRLLLGQSSPRRPYASFSYALLALLSIGLYSGSHLEIFELRVPDSRSRNQMRTLCDVDESDLQPYANELVYNALFASVDHDEDLDHGKYDARDPDYDQCSNGRSLSEGRARVSLRTQLVQEIDSCVKRLADGERGLMCLAMGARARWFADLHSPKLKILRLRVFSSGDGLILQPASPLADAVETVAQRLIEAGLVNYHYSHELRSHRRPGEVSDEKKSFDAERDDAEDNERMKALGESEEQELLVKYVLVVIGVGHAGAFLVFCGELLLWNFKIWRARRLI
ncbi:hypothetical protein QAD02_010263 [Eretmocerus hayati]|uniref:Uncharacterized protein n=1 Tax=Eretmocerus hayati TaxID=131215 RepID=A0ACC2NBS3_9HYME|nr:hypothetical protein QAD02_010263 [Eretmocerus hayati]